MSIWYEHFSRFRFLSLFCNFIKNYFNILWIDLNDITYYIKLIYRFSNKLNFVTYVVIEVYFASFSKYTVSLSLHYWLCVLLLRNIGSILFNTYKVFTNRERKTITYNDIFLLLKSLKYRFFGIRNCSLFLILFNNSIKFSMGILFYNSIIAFILIKYPLNTKRIIVKSYS